MADPQVVITQNTLKKEIDGLRKLGPGVIFDFVSEITLETHKLAVQGVSNGPASGRIYQKYRPRRTHQASAPGEFPQSDTGRLVSSIQFELPKTPARPEGVVGTNLIYGRHLEFKSPGRGGRPWLLPAFNEATQRADALLAKIFKRRNKKG